MKKIWVMLVLLLYIFAIVGFALAEDDNSTGTNSDSVNDDNSASDDGSAITDKEDDSKDDKNETDKEEEKDFEKNQIRDGTIGVKEREQEKKREELHERNRLRINQSDLPEGCEVHGDTLRCNLDSGRVMAIMAGKSGNTILQVKGVNASTRVQLYKENDSFYGVSDNNETVLINYFPDEIRDKIRARIHANVTNEEIELDENGIYRFEAKKRARLFYLVPVREHVRARVDPETGEIIKVRNPWWGFLAKDVEEDTSTE